MAANAGNEQKRSDPKRSDPKRSDPKRSNPGHTVHGSISDAAT
jgi:hypothetical protein